MPQNIINSPRISTGNKRKYVVSFADLKSAGAVLTQDFVLDTLPAGSVLTANRLKHSIPVTGTVNGVAFTTATARLKLVTQAATPITTQLGAAVLDVFAPVGVLDGTSSVSGVTPVAGDAEATTQLIMTVATSGNLSGATAGSINAIVEIIYLGT